MDGRTDLRVTAERLAGLLGELCPPRGIALAGAVALPCPLPHAAAFHGWLAAERHAGLAYLARDPAARTDPTVQRPWARAVLVFAQRYAVGWSPDDRSPWDGAAPGRPWTDGVARFARGRDYHDLLLDDVQGVINGLRERLGPFRAHAAVDTGPYLEREYAWLAGLGFFGRNSCLIHERLGSGLFLGVAAVGLTVDGLSAAGTSSSSPLWGVTPRTTAVSAPRASVPGPASRCGSCRLCQNACPTGALDTPFVLDANRCLSTWTIEWHGRLPAGEEARQGGRLFGCDICQAVCPWNRRAARADGAVRPEFGVDPAHAEVSLADLIEIDPEEFLRRFRRSPLWRAHPDGLRRNAATVAANVDAAVTNGGRSSEEAPG